jgi:DoxX-like family
MGYSHSTSTGRPARRRSMLLWTLQGLLAALFLFTGVVKLVMPAATLGQGTPVPVAFLRFVAVAELCGAAGLVLPGLLGIRPGLTPLAAAGLVVIMIGATIVTATTLGLAPALFPLLVGVLLVVVIRGRRPGATRPDPTR